MKHFSQQHNGRAAHTSDRRLLYKSIAFTHMYPHMLCRFHFWVLSSLASAHLAVYLDIAGCIMWPPVTAQWEHVKNI